MRRRTAAAAVALALLLAACAASAVDPTPAPPVAVAPDVDDVSPPPVCTEPTITMPAGRASDITVGRGDGPAGLAGAGLTDAADRTTTVLDLAAPDGAALLAALLGTFRPCPDVGAEVGAGAGTSEDMVVAGDVPQLVVAAVQATAERRAFVPSFVPGASGTGDGAAAPGMAAATASVELLSRWTVADVLVVAEEDVRAWLALIVEADRGAVPLLLPAAAVEIDRAAAEEATEEATEEAADAIDPALALLALLPTDADLTIVASDAQGATVLTERLGAAGLAPTTVRVLGEATDASSRSAHASPDGSNDSNGTLWLVDPVEPFRALIAAAAAGARGDALLVSDPRDAHDVLRHVDAIRRVAPALILLVGDGVLVDGEVAWQLDAVLHTPLLPWGGLLPLDGNRIVALYGTPDVAALGALGQQDLDATIIRVREQAAAYEDGGLRVVPGFDVIATVASAAAGPLGDYSQRISIDRLRPLVDRARDEGMVVFIDLQPGRTDFLTQAKEYEELLLEPHVFLALDPEWRLGPDEVHLRRIGSVSAAEVQTVADWLAELVRRERLPQKVLMLHQFTMAMLQDRDTIVIPPELIGVLHVDGQGELRKKEGTYRLLTQTRAEHWQWGWKQFLRIDTPSVMEPARVIDRDPSPVVITYQ
jgi:limonene-1,2-epoxide hydrolase